MSLPTTSAIPKTKDQGVAKSSHHHGKVKISKRLLKRLKRLMRKLKERRLHHEQRQRARQGHKAGTGHTIAGANAGVGAGSAIALAPVEVSDGVGPGYEQLDFLELFQGLQIDAGGLNVISGGITTTALNVQSSIIENVATPVNTTDGVNKAYVDANTNYTYTANAVLQASSSGIVQAATGASFSSSGELVLADGLQMSTLTAGQLLQADSNSNIVSSGQVLSNLVDLGSAQTITGNKTFSGATTMSGSQVVNGSTSIQGSTTIGGTLDITAASTVIGSTTITGAVTLSSLTPGQLLALDSNDNIVSSGQTASSLISNLVDLTSVQTISGQKTFTSSILGTGLQLSSLTAGQIVQADSNDNLVSSGLVASNVALLNGAQTFTGANTFNGVNISTLTAGQLLQADSNNNVISSGQTLSNLVDLASTQTISGNKTLSGEITVTGVVTVPNLTPNTLLALNASGQLTTASEQGYVDLTSTQTISGSKTFSGTTSMTGAANLSGTTTLSGPTTFSGATTLSGTTTLPNLTPNTLLALNASGQITTASEQGYVDLTTAQTITGQKTITSPILLNPFVYDGTASNNLLQGQATTTLLANTTTTQTIYAFTGLNLSSTIASTILLDLRLVLNDPNTLGALYEIPVKNGGSLYSGTPTVTITDPTGTGATAVANMSNGSLSSITMTKVGKGYTNPTITLSGGTVLLTVKATLGTPLFGNVFWACRYMPVWNVTSASAASSNASSVVMSEQGGNAPNGWDLTTQFNPSGSGGLPSICVMFNTGGYCNTLTASLGFAICTSVPN